MAAASLDLVDDLRVEQGATWERTFTFSDENNDPIDVSAWTFRGQIRSTYNSDTILAEFEFAAGNSTDEKIFRITDEETTEIPVLSPTGTGRKLSEYMYDIEAEKPDGSVERLFEGKVEVSPEVTR